MNKSNKWAKIGNVTGSTSTLEFDFSLKDFKSRVGDIVALPTSVPSGDYTSTTATIVWGRITGITRTNPFHSIEVGQELANEELTAEETSIPLVKDQLIASAVILGCSDADDFTRLSPLTYPLQPASGVFYPDHDAIKALLTGGNDRGDKIKVGSLIARGDVQVDLSASKVVARHLAILAMTGGGKTVAARRIVRELLEKQYPMLILDPHGDYLGFSENANKFPGVEIKLFYPHVAVTDATKGHVEGLISKMTSGLTEPQREELHALLEQTSVSKGGDSMLSYILTMRSRLEKLLAGDGDGRKRPTYGALRRQLGFVADQLTAMERSNTAMRSKLSKLKFDKLPDAKTAPTQIVSRGQLSVLYLGGYNHILQTTIASMLMEELFAHRANLSGRIPPFSTLIEEAHTFVPSRRESEDVPSIETIRKVITEGRKFGTGLILVSQRPSRIDETILSQCNSFLVLRLVNPKDQTYIRNIMENLSEQDARLLPSFGPGEGIVSGQAVRFPLLVRIQHDADLIYSEINNENFLEEAREWKESAVDRKSADNDARLREIKSKKPGKKK